MMAQRRTGDRLIDRLPSVRGSYAENVSLHSQTWFRVGGPADVVYRPADADDLAFFLANTPLDIPVTVLGVASNTLVRDGGIRGVVIRLVRGFVDVKIAGETVTAGAGTLDVNVALAAAEAGLAGLEFYRGVPGTIGGALRMNAGAYGRETKDVLVDADALDRRGRKHRLSPADFHFSYRHSDVPADFIFTAARFAGRRDDPAAIAARMDEISAAREASQPIRSRTGGSTFVNPTGGKAWQLIDAAGCRGLTVGGAEVSTKHCNFLINTGAATAADIEALGEEVRRRVKQTSGVDLEWEIRRIGERGAP